MDAAEKAISEAYVDPEERVLDPALLEKSALERTHWMAHSGFTIWRETKNQGWNTVNQ